VSERVADGFATEEELGIVHQSAATGETEPAVWLAFQASLPQAGIAASSATQAGLHKDARRIHRYSEPWPIWKRFVCGLLPELFANPFRSISIDPAWLTPTLLSVAQAAYDERSLPSGELDRERLIILSDALEEAGCTDTSILEHLRGPGPHV